MNNCRYVTLLFVALFIGACKNGTSKDASSRVENDSVSAPSARPIYDRLLLELDSTEVYDDSILYGYWFKPHEACAVNIFFHKNGTFEFKYYISPNDSTVVNVVKKGTFSVSREDELRNRVVKMYADDGWDENVFKGVIQYKKNRLNFYLEDKESGLYLVKGSD